MYITLIDNEEIVSLFYILYRYNNCDYLTILEVKAFLSSVLNMAHLITLHFNVLLKIFVLKLMNTLLSFIVMIITKYIGYYESMSK